MLQHKLLSQRNLVSKGRIISTHGTFISQPFQVRSPELSSMRYIHTLPISSRENLLQANRASPNWLSRSKLAGCQLNKLIASNMAKFSTATSYDISKIRNIAIIAHVDHGKTTLMDKLLEHCGSKFSGERAMDSNDQEKERGITITSKYTRLYYKDYELHVVDTPGHADFGGEVERIMSMVDGVVLLVDAYEGVMSQTKFVLSKAMAANKKPIVVLNKIDREGHRAEEVESEIFDLFIALSTKQTSEDLLDYPLLYAAGRQGWVSYNLQDIPGKDGVVPLLETIIKTIPPPNAGSDESFALAVNTMQADNHLGRIVTGKVEHGKVTVGDKVKVISRDGVQAPQTADMKVTKLFYLQGLQRVEVNEAYAGEIVSLAGGCAASGVADTVCSIDRMEPLKTIPLSPPVISMTFGPNSSPLSGREGTRLTSSMIKERLHKEVENNVTLSLTPSSDSECIDVQGRGELQIGILVETLRREGFELTVSPPKVLGVTVDGQYVEPYEEVMVDISPELQGLVIDSMSERKGVMTEFKTIGQRARLIFQVPSRGMLGFRHTIANATRGDAVVNSIFSHYEKVNPREFNNLRKGKLVSMDAGKATGYALMPLEERGVLFVTVGDEVYEGMVVGENAKSGELEVNPCKLKKLSNMRSTGAEEKVMLAPPRKMTVEEVIAYMDEDEVVEVTPKNIRLRKRILDSTLRGKYNKANKPMK